MPRRSRAEWIGFEPPAEASVDHGIVEGEAAIEWTMLYTHPVKTPPVFGLSDITD
jgi:hypothetical protein